MWDNFAWGIMEFTGIYWDLMGYTDILVHFMGQVK
jgi:hypothetical protein